MTTFQRVSRVLTMRTKFLSFSICSVSPNTPAHEHAAPTYISVIMTTGADGPEDELRDLSPDDAEELRAFLDKRRWFEGKLAVSSQHPLC